MIKNDLEKLGFSNVEVNAYIALLELGGAFVSTIARKAKAHRVTTYNTLENLAKKGFVKYTRKKGALFYYPENPQVIFNKIEASYKTAKILIPELLNLQKAHKFKPKIQFYDGLEQIQEIFRDMLESSTEVIGYTNFEIAHELFPEYLEDYNKKVLLSGQKHRLLCPNDLFHDKYAKNQLNKRISHGVLEILAINPEQFPFKNAQYIYEDKVASVSFDKEEMIGVILESPSNAETNRSIFDLAWLGATSFVAK